MKSPLYPQSPPQFIHFVEGSRAKICLVYVHPKDQWERKTKACDILDDQSNVFLARSALFKMFNIEDDTSSYTLRTCAGVSETAGQRAKGFLVESADGSTSLVLSTLIGSDQLPDNTAEITTPSVVKYHLHLRSLASKIFSLDLKVKILLFLGRGIIQAQNVMEQHNGPPRAPFAQ